VPLVHRDTAETPLPEMPGQLLAGMATSGIGAMKFGKRRTQGVGMIGHEDKVRMVGQQDPAPHRHAMGRTLHGKQIAIGRIIIVAKEYPLTTIALLRHMMRTAGHYKAGETDMPHRRIAGPKCRFGVLSP